MNKIPRPKKPTIKKPSLPREPNEPANYKSPVEVAEVTEYFHCKVKIGKSFAALLGEEESLEFEIEGGWLEINEYCIYFYPLNENYEEDLAKYEKNMISYRKKLKEYEPKVVEYEAKMAEYEVKLLEWKKHEAEQRLFAAQEKTKIIKKGK